MDESILSISDLNFGYDKELLFEDLNLNLKKGDFAALVGDNGAGKSTLIKLIIGQLKPKSGKINLNLSKENYKSIAYVPQIGTATNNDFPITVEEIVSLPIYNEIKFFKKISKKNKDKIIDALAHVGLENKINSIYKKLSGGQKQKVLIAKALVAQPDLLILDEPTSGVDYKSRMELYKLLEHLIEVHNMTILIITHNLKEIKKYIMKVFLLSEGNLKEYNNDNISLLLHD